MKINGHIDHSVLMKRWSFLMKFGRSSMGYFIVGIASVIWILIRLIPKPSRIQYPCMKATLPVASSFILYIFGITGIAFFFKKARQFIYQARYLFAGGFVILGIAAGIITLVNTRESVLSMPLQGFQAGNQPIGIAKGVFPGRVVWVQNTDATDEFCTNDINDYWYMDKNTNQDVVNTMLSSGLMQLTGAISDIAAWDSLFRYYNRAHAKGNVGYQKGEKIVIKINLNGIWNSNPDKNVNTSPQICYAILNQLVNSAGVSQSDIYIGDPNCPMNDATYNKCHNAFPNVKYWGNGIGRVPATQSASAVLFAADKSFEDPLPQEYIDAAYMINIPVLKKHHRAGISLCSKNHFGSIGAFTNGAWHLHPSLPCPDASGEVVNGDYGVYRCFVDIMGHKDLGGKTILYLVDGLWGSTNWGHPPIKWRMAPFNNDWPSSLFLSQDPVAIESVGYDFLYEEFDESHPTEGSPATEVKGPFSRFEGTDDYLHQAADPTNWPTGVQYDPENDGSILASLGTHEHWNNATDKKYSRNLGTGNGIELLYLTNLINNIHENELAEGIDVYPNPVTSEANIHFNLQQNAHVMFEIYLPDGKLIERKDLGELKAGDNTIFWNPEGISGCVIGKLSVGSGNRYSNYTIKINLNLK
jgi:hypothetical protein